MSMESSQFKLSKELIDHQQDVRAVCVFEYQNEPKVCTSSRDTTVKVWNALTGELEKTLIGHQHFVGALTPFSVSGSFPIQTIASGGNDNLIIIWDLEKGAPWLTLIGHENIICALSTTPDGLLISGSCDKTARIWQGNQCIAILTGHEHNVWAVLGLPNGDIVTGSADKTIKIWRGNNCVKTLTKHTDCVRGLAIAPENVGFLSCGNDGIVFIWSFEGECLYELHGHNSFIYNISSLPSGEILSVSEDRTLKVWKNSQCIQTIMHTGSVWCVTGLPNGDIVTGCSDSVARLWTRDPSRVGSAQVLQDYEKKLASQSLPSSGTIGDIELQKLPGTEALGTPGTKDQEIKVVRNGDNAEAYQWSQVEGRWIKVGEVVDARGSSKEKIDGKEYDYVFDVDVGDGRMRKLGYNNNQNPYTAAQEFLWKEELSNEFLDQVAKFIIENTKPITLGEQTSGNVDPYTGGAPYSTTATFQHFPYKSPLFFENADCSKILKKLLELNLTQIQNNDPLALNEQEEQLLKQLMTIIMETSQYQQSSFSDEQFAVLQKLTQWSESCLFPVLDVLRLFILHQDGAKKVSQSNFLSKILQVGIGSSSFANQMLSLRFIANMFKYLQDLVLSQSEMILDKAADLAKSSKSNVRIALATVILNFSTFDSLDQERKLQLVSILSELLESEQDSEVLYRSFVALGNCIWKDNDTKQLLKDLEINKIVQEKGGSTSVGKVKEVAGQLLQNL